MIDIWDDTDAEQDLDVAPSHLAPAVGMDPWSTSVDDGAASTYIDCMDVDRLVTLLRAARDDDPQAGLAAAAEARHELERLEAVLVRRARIQGRTWAEIAAALGVSKQAVHKKHGGRGLFRNQD